MSVDCKGFVLVGLAVGLLLPAVLSAQPLMIEAESFTAHSDLGGNAIQSVTGSGCSGGQQLMGLDYAGEWTEYDVPVSGFGYYSLYVRCLGDLNQPYTLRMIFTPVGTGTEQVVDFSFTGKGYTG